MSAPTAVTIAGVCALSFGAALAAGTMTRQGATTVHDPVAPAPAHTRVASLAPAAGLPGLRISPSPRSNTVRKRSRAPSKAAPQRSTASPPPTETVAFVPEPAPSPAPQPVRNSPPPAARRPAATAPSPRKTAPKSTAATAPPVTFFDDGG
jgi:hypothetical protein